MSGTGGRRVYEVRESRAIGGIMLMREFDIADDRGGR